MSDRIEPGDAIAVALRVATALESVGGSYFVGGSLASSFQGEPRATNDIDLVISCPLGRIPAFVSALGPDFEVDVDVLRTELSPPWELQYFLPAHRDEDRSLRSWADPIRRE